MDPYVAELASGKKYRIEVDLVDKRTRIVRPNGTHTGTGGLHATYESLVGFAVRVINEELSWRDVVVRVDRELPCVRTESCAVGDTIDVAVSCTQCGLMAAHSTTVGPGIVEDQVRRLADRMTARLVAKGCTHTITPSTYLEQAGLSTRALNVLFNRCDPHEPRTIADVSLMSERFLRGRRGCGPGTALEIRRIVERAGLKLRAVADEEVA